VLCRVCIDGMYSLMMGPISLMNVLMSAREPWVSCKYTFMLCLTMCISCYRL
jgi:hypothetical protein